MHGGVKDPSAHPQETAAGSVGGLAAETEFLCNVQSATALAPQTRAASAHLPAPPMVRRESKAAAAAARRRGRRWRTGDGQRSLLKEKVLAVRVIQSAPEF